MVMLMLSRKACIQCGLQDAGKEAEVKEQSTHERMQIGSPGAANLKKDEKDLQSLFRMRMRNCLKFEYGFKIMKDPS